jgi:hypothetical protein
MSSAEDGDFLNGAKLLELLSEGEMATYEAADSKTHLRRGDEYLDLEHLQLGVQRADGTATSMGALLPRKAIHEDTWRRLLRHLKAARVIAPAPSSEPG